MKLKLIKSPLKITLLYIGSGLLWLLVSFIFIQATEDLANLYTLALKHAIAAFIFFGFSSVCIFLALNYYRRKLGVAEFQLHEIELKQKLIVQNATDAIISIDAQNKIVFANRAAETLTGYKLTDLIGQQTSKIMPADLVRRHAVSLENYVTTNKRSKNWSAFETTLLSADGLLIPIELSFSEFKLDGQHYFSAIFRDIRLRKQQEELLKASELKYRSIVETSSDVFVFCNKEGIVTYVSPSVKRVLGYERDEILGYSAFNLFAGQNQLRAKNAFKNCIENLAGNTHARLEILNNSGEKRFIDVEYRNFIDDAVVNSIVINFHDVTDLANSLSEIQAIYEISSDVICVAGADGFYKKVNPAFEKMLGYTEEEALSRSYFEFIHPDDIGITRKAIAESMEVSGPRYFENRFICKNGSVKWLNWSGNYDKENQVFYAVARDITETRSINDKIKESEERFRAAAEGSFDAFLLLKAVKSNTGNTVDFLISETNFKAELLLNKTKKELKDKLVSEILTCKNGNNLLSKFITAYNNQQTEEEEFSAEPIYGVHAEWLRQLLVPLNEGLAVTWQDISVRKKNDLALAESRAGLKAVLENTQEGIWSVDTNNKVLMLNGVFKKLIRDLFDTDINIGSDYLQCIPQNSRKQYLEIFEKVRAGESLTRESKVYLNGKTHYLETSISPIFENGSVTGMNQFLRDITAKKEMEQTIRNIATGVSSSIGQEFFNSLNEYINSIIECQFVSIGRISDIKNPDSVTTMSLTVEGKFTENITYQLNDTPCNEVVNKDTYLVAENAYLIYPNDEFIVNLKTEGYVGTPLRNSKGEVMGVMALGTKSPLDNPQWIKSVFTIFAARAEAELERLMAEEELMHSNANLQALIENTDESIWFLDKDFKVLITNSTFNKVFSGIFEKEPKIGMNYLNCIPDEARDSFISIFNRALAGEKLVLERSYILDGKPRFFDMNVNPIKVKNEIIGVSYFVKDVTDRLVAENKIRESEQKYRNLIENMAEGVVYFNNTSQLGFANDQFYEMLGYTQNELSGKNVFDMLLTQQGKALMHLKTSIAIKSGVAQTFELQLFCKSRTQLWASVNAVALFDNFREYTGLLCTISDITEKKQTLENIKRKETKYRTLVNTMKEGMVQIDIDARITFVNHRFCEMSGYSEDELLGSNVFEMLRDNEEKQIIANEWENRKTGVSTQYEARLSTKTGEKVWVLITGSPLFDEHFEITGSIVTLTDITVLKTTEEHLRNINQELNTFVYKSSHDLKGPLASIIGLTNLAINEVEDETAKSYLDLIGQGANKLQLTLTDLLDTIKIKEGKVTLSYINFRELFNDVLTSLAHNQGYERLNFKINVPEDVTLISDKKILRSVVQNLVDNAIKYQDYNKPELTIDVSISAVPQQKVKIEISDNGMGILESSQSKIFDMFYRASLDSKGTGLGLYIVKKAIERLEGNISLSSKEGVGSTFTIILPSAEAEVTENMLEAEADTMH